MAREPQTPRSLRAAPDKISVGGTVLLSANALGAEWGLTLRKTLSALRRIGIPLFWINQKGYFNLFSLEQVICALTEPGSTGFALPSSNKSIDQSGRTRADLAERLFLDDSFWADFREREPRRLLCMEVASLLYTTLHKDALEARLRELGSRLILEARDCREQRRQQKMHRHSRIWDPATGKMTKLKQEGDHARPRNPSSRPLTDTPEGPHPSPNDHPGAERRETLPESSTQTPNPPTESPQT